MTSFCETIFQIPTIGDLPVLILFISIFHGGHGNLCGENNIKVLKYSI